MPDPGTLQLPLDDAAQSQQRARRVPRARAGQRGPERRTSLLLRQSDERLLDALSDHYSAGASTPVGIGETIRRALREAAATQGMNVDDFEKETATAA